MVEKIALEGAVPVLRAEEELARGGVPDGRVYDVVLAATGSESQASRAFAARLAWRMEQQTTAGG